MYKGLSLLNLEELCRLEPADIKVRLACLLHRKERFQRTKPNGGRGKVKEIITGIKGFDQEAINRLELEVTALRQEMKAYLTLFATTPKKDLFDLLWRWWWSRKDEKEWETWSKLAQIAALCAPSSAAVERLFSIIKGSTSPLQAKEKPETLECRHIVRYNKGVSHKPRRGKYQGQGQDEDDE